ncbi:Uncharacterised protein [Mycobacterium tuberculosis]|nr:Uncharacterised protein [Mycobacterium tuberculosis]
MDGGCVVRASVVRPKTPRGDGNSKPCCTATRNSCTSSDPKPREGTETWKRSTSLTILFSRRQTQNPERGRKLHIDFLDLARREDHVVRPKTPREDGNSSTIASMSMSQSSSRQTQNPERGRKPASGKSVRSKRFQRVVRPKTPRGDGNARNRPTWACPQRVVRPKTPRGDGNWTQNRTGCGRCSSRQTQNPERGRKPSWWDMDERDYRGRRTQNPERGRKLDCANWLGADPGGRQTQNPERGRKPDDGQ